MNTTSPTDLIRQQFETSCVDLFNSLDCAVERQDTYDMDMGGAPVAYIDAGSDDMEAIIVLRVPLSVLTMTYPDFAADSIMDVSEEVLEDWILELANQLVGRFKNKMITQGCQLKIGLPSMYYHAGEASLNVEGHALHRYVFEVDRESVGCNLYLQVFNPELHLNTAAAELTSNEGELELF